jgi:peptidoglycan/LPS O-acetylase OafA/YrhL
MARNNFDQLRLLSAISVLISHSFVLSVGTNVDEPIYRLSHQQVTLGRIAVAVFFIISGFLITGSYLRSPSPLRFVWARALRLFPALSVTLGVLAVVVGPVLTTLSLGEYFSTPGVLRFVAVNLSLTGFVSGLPGVFEHNPFPIAVDGSLWTLHYEAECYGLVLLCGIAGLLNRWVMLALFIPVIMASGMSLGGPRIEFASYFIGGAMMHLWKPPLRRVTALLCSLLLCITLLMGGFRPLCATAGAYLVCYVALRFRPIQFQKAARSDLSYGIYIWAFPVQQTVAMALGSTATWWVNILISIPAVLGFAWLSWHVVENPALSLKHKLPLCRRTFVQGVFARGLSETWRRWSSWVVSGGG